MALGGILAVSDRRYRTRKSTVTKPQEVLVTGALA
jgi:hypothetical protein